MADNSWPFSGHLNFPENLRETDLYGRAYGEMKLAYILADFVQTSCQKVAPCHIVPDGDFSKISVSEVNFNV